ncbi:MAG: hypothetical protein AABW90_00550 [Nanoarchaeota archaeon]
MQIKNFKAYSRFESSINLKLLPDSKHSQSEIMGTVILILIVVSISIILLTFAVPFVKERLAGTDCFNVINQVSFSDSKYTCFDNKNDVDATNDEINLQVHFGELNESLEGFLIELGGAASKSIEIKEGNINDDGIWMYNSVDTDPLKLPGKNEERTYVILNEYPEYVRIYPILTGGKTCDVSDIIDKLPLCK